MDKIIEDLQRGMRCGTVHEVTEFTDDPATIKLTKEMAEAVALMALDGYSNATAFLGAQSPLLSAGTFVRSGIGWDMEQLTTAYRENWIAKRIIDMPSEDMTRAGYRLTCSADNEMMERFHQTEAKHSVKQELANAIRWARLYGGSIALMVIRGDEKHLDKPLDPDLLMPGCFKGLLVLDRTRGIEPSPELVDDLDDPDFGLPEYYSVPINVEIEGMRTVKIHHSRVLRFIGRELPQAESERESFWGASELEHIWDELMKRSAASANIAQLMFQANITTLKMGNLGANLAMGSDKMRNNVIQTIENENRLRTSYGLQIMSADDSLENHSYSFTGLAEIYEAFMMDMSGAAEIPATKLFGRAPQGMNATGEADMRNYYDMIAQMQERQLRPALEKLLPVMAISCWGYVPKDLGFVFEPVMTISPEKRSKMTQECFSDIFEAARLGLVSREEARAEMKARGSLIGVWERVG